MSPFFNYTQLLSDIEEHLKCTITQCEPDIKIPVDEFDGKVTYGQRRALGGPLHNVENQGFPCTSVACLNIRSAPSNVMLLLPRRQLQGTRRCVGPDGQRAGEPGERSPELLPAPGVPAQPAVQSLLKTPHNRHTADRCNTNVVYLPFRVFRKFSFYHFKVKN